MNLESITEISAPSYQSVKKGCKGCGCGRCEKKSPTYQPASNYSSAASTFKQKVY